MVIASKLNFHEWQYRSAVFHVLDFIFFSKNLFRLSLMALILVAVQIISEWLSIKNINDCLYKNTFLSLFAAMKFYYALFLVALVMASAFYVEGCPGAGDCPGAEDHPDLEVRPAARDNPDKENQGVRLYSWICIITSSKIKWDKILIGICKIGLLSIRHRITSMTSLQCLCTWCSTTKIRF